MEGIGFSNGIITIVGTDGDDEIELKTRDSGRVLIVEAEFNDDNCNEREIELEFPLSQVTTIIAYLGNGDDEYEGDFSVNSALLKPRQIIFGEAGNDELKVESATISCWAAKVRMN